MKRSQKHLHWLLMLVLGVAIGLTVVSCGSEEAKEAPGEEMPAPERDQDLAPEIYDTEVPSPVPFTTQQGDVGFITLFPGAPNEYKIDLGQYVVAGQAPKDSVVNDQIKPNTNVSVESVVPYNSAPPYTGPGLPAPGVTDQPVTIHGKQMD